MSCIGSQEWIVMLAQFLENEKKDTRVWLRAEMDRLVDPMLNSIFNRLATQLISGLERTVSTGAGTNVLPQSSSTLIVQPPNLVLPSNTLYISSLNPTSFLLNPQYVQSPQFTTSPVPPTPVSITNAQITLPNKLTNGAFTNVQSRNPINTIETTNANGSNNESHFPQSLSAPNVVNESQPNQLNSDEDKDENEDEDEDEEDDDECDDCVIIDPIDQDDDDSVKLMIDEEYEEESDKSLKKAKLDTTAQEEVHNNQHCFTNQTQANRVTHQTIVDKQCITVHLECTEPDCWDTFAPQKLNKHMLEKHHLGPYRCLVKDCRQSFYDRRLITEHITQHHHHTTQLQCAKCVKNFPKYNLLFHHNFRQHQVGQFECAFPWCPFTEKSRTKVYDHYTQQHKQTINCQQPGCNFQATTPYLLKKHQLFHSGIKPYRCKWPRCEHASAHKCHAMVHIRSHIARIKSSDPNGAQLDPNDFLEVMHHLL